MELPSHFNDTSAGSPKVPQHLIQTGVPGGPEVGSILMMRVQPLLRHKDDKANANNSLQLMLCPLNKGLKYSLTNQAKKDNYSESNKQKTTTLRDAILAIMFQKKQVNMKDFAVDIDKMGIICVKIERSGKMGKDCRRADMAGPDVMG